MLVGWPLPKLSVLEVCAQEMKTEKIYVIFRKERESLLINFQFLAQIKNNMNAVEDSIVHSHQLTSSIFLYLA